MDELRAYQRRRLALADVLRAALDLARAAHDDRLEGEARALLARLAGDRFTLVVAGQFSRGKSTLMNAILGAPYLPTGVVPMTSVITTIVYGSRQRAAFRRRGSDIAIEIPLEQVPDLIAQNSKRRAELQVTTVDIQLPAEILRLGFAFVDTPGIGSAIGANSATTRRFLPRADAVVFVTGFDSAFTQAEVDLLQQIAHQRTPLFCVVNKRDLVDTDEASTVVTSVASVLAGASVSDTEIFPLSALGGLNAKRSADSDALAASGLPMLESVLQQFLTARKARVFLSNVAERTAALAARERRDLSLGTFDGATRGNLEQLFAQRIKQLVVEQHACEERIRSCVRLHLGGLIESCRTRWQRDLARRLRGSVDGFEPPSRDRDLLEPSAIGETLAQATADHVREWTFACVAEVTEMLVGLAAGELDRLYDAADSPSVFGPELAGRPLPEDAVMHADWTSSDLPQPQIPRLDWSVQVDTTDWRHLRHSARAAQLHHRIDSAIDVAVADATQRLTSAAVELADHWVSDVVADATKRCDDAVERFRSHLASPPSDDDAAALDTLVTSAERLLAEIAAAPALPTPAAPADRLGGASGSARDGERECVVCVAMRDGLISFMSHSQFMLATRARDQIRHARGRGFCPTHTWLYHGIASPLGISAGYAAVAESAAERLDKAAASRSPAPLLASLVDELVVPSEGCPACRVLAETERLEVGRHVRGPDGADLPVLCVAHTARVLERNPSADRARALTRAVAANLRRDSEDMRSYALKREARYRWLITDEESRAYRETLRLLAGDALLARAGEGEKDMEFPEGETARSGGEGAS
ncbi:MAG TPA: dynamin family protein [Humibacter sp.]|nr:dynamin family protein [Humibacter sp.]